MPFHLICNPIQASRNDDNRRITLLAAGPSSAAMRSANPFDRNIAIDMVKEPMIAATRAIAR